MARFRFNLEPVLKLRRFEEEAAQRALAESLRSVEAQKKRLAVLDNEREELLTFETLKQEYIPTERQRFLLYLSVLETRLNAARLDLKIVEAVVLEKRDALHTAAKAKKVLEKLRERRFETFKSESRRKEYADIDEAVIQRLERN